MIKTEILKNDNIYDLTADLLKYYSENGGLPEYDIFKKRVFDFYAWNHLKVKNIKELYKYLKIQLNRAEIIPKIKISAEDFEYFKQKKNNIQSEEIKKCIERLENSELALYHKREGKTTPLVEEIPNTYGVDYYDQTEDNGEAVFYKTVNRETWKKLEKLQNTEFKLMGHVRIDNNTTILNGKCDAIKPKNLHITEKSDDKTYRKKLNDLKSKTVKKLKKKYMVFYKNNSGKSIAELVDKIHPPKPYIHKSCNSYTIIFENPKFLDTETMEPTEEMTKYAVSLINEFEKQATEHYTYLNHINPFYNVKPKNTWEIENTVLAIKRGIERKHCNLKNDNTARILTLNGNYTEHETDNYIGFFRFFTRWIRKEKLIDNVQDIALRDELRRLNPRGVKLNRLEKAKLYISKIYKECFNSSILI